MTECRLSDLEEYDPNKFLKKDVHKGERTTVALLHLLPGQEVPTHSHSGVEIMLLPQKGEAELTVDGREKLVLKPGIFSLNWDQTIHSASKTTAQTPFRCLLSKCALVSPEVNHLAPEQAKTGAFLPRIRRRKQRVR